MAVFQGEGTARRAALWGDRDMQLGGLLLALCLLVASSTVYASAGGRSGFSGDPGTNAGSTCTVCHAPDGAASPSIGIGGPTTMDAGTTRSFLIFMDGGPAVTAGFGLSVGEGHGTLTPYDAETHVLDGELTHIAPKAFSAGAVLFAFDYTAPNYDADVTLYAAGNSTDGSLGLSGDGIGTTTFGITVVNGFEPPPDPPDPPQGELEAALFASGFVSPVVIENAGDDRLFVVEKPGRIRIVESDGTVRATPFLDIETLVDDSASEQGLLGLAFHPDYVNNGYFYVYYTRDPNGPAPGPDISRISRFRVSLNPNLANASSELVLMEFAQPFNNHNGGDIHFGPDGHLHIASGDGGSGGDPFNNSQDTDSLLGKMLRIDVDTPPTASTGPDCNTTGGSNYSIPAGNAFEDGAGGDGCDEIFVLGVRNPWRFSFDSLTGAMWIADVGQNDFEEVHYLPPGGIGGLNLGWRCYEGFAPFNLNGCNLAYLPPVHAYSHTTAGCSVTGGRVYRGPAVHLQGQYFFSDFCQSSIRALSGDPNSPAHRVVIPTGELSSVSTFGENIDGELFVAEIDTGDIYRLDPVLPPGCDAPASSTGPPRLLFNYFR
ncbi:MAG: hypothetical protein HKN19_00035 [Halioglobus sp.]|nr:hypothetical protein [Halioglobus sp.]